MKPFNILSELNIINWSVLLIGLQNKLISSQDIADYSADLLTKSDDFNAEVLSYANNLSIHEVESLLIKASDGEDIIDAAERWRLAHLIELSNRSISDQDKIDELQYLYSYYNYPDDMAACSIYSQDQIDPLHALSNTINKLKSKLNVSI